ncbi:hypothetical protein BH10PSE7_BH10PSE7_08490 [soil metagenome]
MSFSANLGIDDLASRDLPSFASRLARLENVLPEPLWRRLGAEVGALVDSERTYLPAHKKGGTVAYATLEQHAPGIVAVYRSPEFRHLISGIVGIAVEPTPLHDQSSCSLLFYDRPGDHIGWHYDHNFYRGRHFTVLVPLVNRGHGPDGLSAARLIGHVNGREVIIPTAPNSMIVFEGARVRHKVMPIAEGEYRVVWSMTYCADPRNSAWQGLARRVKDTAFFGLRALWT